MRRFLAVVTLSALAACSSSSHTVAPQPTGSDTVVASMRVPKDTTIFASGRPIDVALFVSNAKDAQGNPIAHPHVTVASAPAGWVGSGTASRVAPRFGTSSASDTTITPVGDQSGTVVLAAGIDTATVQILAQVDMNRYHWEASYGCRFSAGSYFDSQNRQIDSAYFLDALDTAGTSNQGNTLVGESHVEYFANDSAFDDSFPVFHVADELLGVDTVFVGFSNEFLTRANADTATFPKYTSAQGVFCPSTGLDNTPLTPTLLEAMFDKTTQLNNTNPSRVKRRRSLRSR